MHHMHSLSWRVLPHSWCDLCWLVILLAIIQVPFVDWNLFRQDCPIIPNRPGIKWRSRSIPKQHSLSWRPWSVSWRDLCRLVILFRMVQIPLVHRSVVFNNWSIRILTPTLFKFLFVIQIYRKVVPKVFWLLHRVQHIGHNSVALLAQSPDAYCSCIWSKC